MVMLHDSKASSRHAAILSTGAYFPNDRVTNEQLVSLRGHAVTAKAVQKIYGVEERHVADPSSSDSDLLAEAARRCLGRARLPADKLSKLIVTKFLGDRLLPMTAAFVQRKLKCATAIQSLDVDGGISSFIQALDLANLAIASGDEYVLVVSGGIHHRLVDCRDPQLAFLYGDGAAAVLVGRNTQPGFEARVQLSIPEFATRAVGFEIRNCFPKTAEELADSQRFYRLYRTCDEKSAWGTLLEASEQVVARLLGAAGLVLSDIDLVLVSENYRKLQSAILERLGIEASKSLSLIHRYGNTMSAMLPVLLDHAIQRGRVSAGARILLLSLGEGVSVGGLIVRLPNDYNTAEPSET